MCTELIYRRSHIDNTKDILEIIHTCLTEVNYIGCSGSELNEAKEYFNEEWLKNLIETRHYYSVWYKDEIIACGGVSKDETKVKQCYFTAVFVDPKYSGKGVGKELVNFLENDAWSLESKLIEIPSSQNAHGFYHKLGYEYREFPPKFDNQGDVTIMFKIR